MVVLWVQRLLCKLPINHEMEKSIPQSMSIVSGNLHIFLFFFYFFYLLWFPSSDKFLSLFKFCTIWYLFFGGCIKSGFSLDLFIYIKVEHWLLLISDWGTGIIAEVQILAEVQRQRPCNSYDTSQCFQISSRTGECINSYYCRFWPLPQEHVKYKQRCGGSVCTCCGILYRGWRSRPIWVSQDTSFLPREYS